MKVQNSMRRKLEQALNPSYLEIIDESHQHEGHAGHNPEGESHFALRIKSNHFAGLSRLNRHRMVHEILKDELRDHIHALRIELAIEV